MKDLYMCFSLLHLDAPEPFLDDPFGVLGVSGVDPDGGLVLGSVS
jgi:hypothetical protein